MAAGNLAQATFSEGTQEIYKLQILIRFRLDVMRQLPGSGLWCLHVYNRRVTILLADVLTLDVKPSKQGYLF